MSVRIESMGFATPFLERTQQDIGREQAQLWNLSASSQERWQRMIDHCGIERRAAVMPLKEIVSLTTSQRMKFFSKHAPVLAVRAIEQALARGNRAAQDITDLIVVTCTGFESPGPLHDICVRAGLSASVRTSQIGFMGCFGGICGLDAAAGAALRHEGAVVLLVCVELCSLHLRNDRDAQNMVASLLFADGAAALIVSNNSFHPPLITVGPRQARRIPETAHAMSWQITDAGFAMTLDRSVPAHIEQTAPIALGDLRQCAIHPGGSAILDAMERGANARTCGGLAPESLSAARGVLRDHGNMSSGSVFFVLDRLLQSGVTGDMAVIAFGPGLTVDQIHLAATPAHANHAQSPQRVVNRWNTPVVAQ
jgi:predicted naringenin-chalcone synthase